MTVGELAAELEACDPEDTLVWEARSEAFLVIVVRPGMHQPWVDPDALHLTKADRRFLDTLHIRDS